jgi:drug/metabolite transporter (DMT)-like permease
MKPSDEKFLKRWSQERAKGRWRYMLVVGVLSWGAPMFIAMTFFVSRPAHLTPDAILISAILWVIGGLAFGALVWFFSERRFGRLAPSAPEETGDQVTK